MGRMITGLVQTQLAVLLAGSLAFAVGCSSEPPVDPDAPVVLVSPAGDSTSCAAAEVRGVLSVDSDRCLRLDGYLVIWPDGTRWDSTANALRLTSGDLARIGTAVSGGGGYATGSVGQGSLAEGQPAERCTWDGEIAIFNRSSEVELAE
jgi:hypothetical protein